MTNAVVSALSVVTLFSVALVLLMHFSVRRVLSRPVPSGGTRPAVSILKPLRGIDDALAENLESFAALSYPDYEILLGAEDPLDPALEVARAFARRHPQRPIRIVVCDQSRALNPKVRVLETLAAHARHQILLISDSNVRVAPRFLADSVAELSDPRVSLVTNLVIGAGEERLGAAMENAHLNSYIAGAIAMSEVVAGRACVLGKSMLFRRADFEALVGWRAIRAILAEDYFVGRRFELAGRRVALSPHPVTTWNATWEPSRFFARHVRWGQLRRRLSPAAYTGELLLNPAPWALATLFASLGLDGSARTAGVSLALGALLIKLASDAVLSARLVRAAAGIPSPAVTLLKDLALPAVWLTGALKQTVAWRGNYRRLGRYTRLAPLKPDRSATVARKAA